ncbi:MAG: NitT/TauT family transport system ATP-binding protein [Herbaspirillum sp.]|nr:NitT/TauT family transport system ATP-binding protein [Herbaspirillum sp.]
MNNGMQEYSMVEATVAPAPPAYVEIRNVSKVYSSKRGTVEALRDVSLTVQPGQFVSVLGPSGCGKSTLLRCIAGLEQPSSGSIRLRGETVLKPMRGMGMVFQKDVLLDWRTILDNVMLSADFRGRPRRECIARAHALLDLFGLNDFDNRYPWELSGGMRMRAAICRALLDEPELLLMDEPFAALDAFTRDDLNLELQKINLKTNSTTIFITHNITEAIFLADKVVVMDRRPGRIALVLDIDLPKPRPLSIRETPQFAQYGTIIRQTFVELGILRNHV